MVRSLILALMLLATMAAPALATTISGGSASSGSLGGPAAEPPPSSFVTLADSTFGTAATGRNNLTEYVPILRPLRALPLDTSGWNRDTSLGNVCSGDNTTATAFVTLYNNAPNETVIVLPNCDIIVNASNNGTALTLNTRDFIEVEGQANSRFVMGELAPRFVETGSYATVAPDTTLFQFGPENGELAGIQTCTWTGGYARGTKKIELTGCGIESSGASGWAVGDLVYIETDAFPSAGPGSSRHRVAHRITCVDGATTGRVGTTEGCNELDDDEQIQIDQPLLMTYNESHPGGSYTGHRVRLIERIGEDRGGLGEETTNVPEYIGWKNVKFYRPNGHLYNSGAAAFRMTRAADWWFVDNDFQRWGYGWITPNLDSSRILIHGNKFSAQTHRARCVGELLSVVDNGSGIARVTMQRVPVESDCSDGRMAAGTETLAYFSSTAAPVFADKFFKKSGVISSTSNTVTFDLLGLTYDPVTMANDEVGLVAVHNNWNVGGIFINGPANNIHIVNNLWDGSRIGPLYQDGAAYIAYIYNWMDHAATEHCSRGFFSHGNEGAPGVLIEGVRSDCGMVPWASARTRSGDATPDLTYNTYFKVRLVDTLLGASNTFPNNGGEYWDEPSGIRGSMLIAEDSDLDGGINYKFTMLSVLMGEPYGPQKKFDEGDPNGDPPPGPNPTVAPYFNHTPTLLRNRCYAPGCNLDDNLEVGADLNPTTWAPDITGDTTPPEADEQEGVPAEWAGDVLPTSLYYEAVDMVNGKPWWYCNEATTPFGEIGAHYDDMGVAERTLPALVKWTGTCTLPTP